MRVSFWLRRIHLYCGLALLSWVFLYGVSSIPFSHGRYFEERDRAKGLPLWSTRWERTWEIAPPSGAEKLREWGARVMADTGLKGAYGVYRQGPNQVNIYVYRFFRSTQVKYFVAEKKLVAEDRRFRFDHFLTGMHAKGGFEQEGFWHKAWAVVVDLVCLALVGWVGTGLYMWWQLKATRGWGAVALAAGGLSFGLLLATL